MLPSKLISLCKATFLILCMTVSGQACADYYVEYMHDPCVDYNACHPAPMHHARAHHYRHHYRRHAYQHRRSSATISVYYYWDVYPAYPCDTCRVVQRCNQGCAPYTRAPVEYHDNDYHSSYYSATSDVDYDTSTADDMGSPYRR